MPAITNGRKIVKNRLFANNPNTNPGFVEYFISKIQKSLIFLFVKINFVNWSMSKLTNKRIKNFV